MNKQKAIVALDEIASSVSDAVRLFLVRVEEDGKVPSEIEIPNLKTRCAMAELEAGKGTASDNLEGLFSDLGL